MNKICISLLLVIFSFNLFNHHLIADETATFWGLNPSITVEPFYAKGEMDINILPIIFQKTITENLDIRVSSILNYGVRQSANKISHLGAQVLFPYYFSSKTELTKPSSGLYLAPVLGITRNILEKHNNIGLHLEPGYNIMITEDWSISFGIQLGVTYFMYDADSNKLRSHFGIKITIGKWI